MSKLDPANDDDFEYCVDSVYETVFGILVSIGATSVFLIALAFSFR